MTDLVLPSADTVTAAEIERFAIQAREWRAQILAAKDRTGAQKGWRELNALERYVADAKARRALQAETRRTEIVIGELLGPAVVGTNQHSNGRPSKFEELHDQYIADFRFLSDHAPLAENAIANGVTRRLALLRAIRTALQKPPPPGTAHIAHADWRDWLPVQPECELLLTDPPYMTNVEDVQAFASDWLPVALGKVKAGGRAYVFVGAYPEEMHAYMNVAMPTQILVWSYRNTIGPSSTDRYALNWQAILYYCTDDAGPLHSDSLSDKFAAQQINAPDGRHGEGRYHAWEKPLELASKIVELASVEGDTVLDPFAGTGTHLLAAAGLGRVGLGCDRDEAMVNLARSRGVAHAA